LNDTNRVGRINELKAVAKAMSKNLIVAEPYSVEPFDLLVQNPNNLSEFLKCQVKTLYYREDRDAFVIYAKKGKNVHYSLSEVDVFLAVYKNAVYWVEHIGNGEYWAKNPNQKWRKL
jgi:hypothetical protein